MKDEIIIFIDNNSSTLQLLKDYFYDLEKKKLFFSSTKEFFSWVEKNKTKYKFMIISDYEMYDVNGLVLFQKLNLDKCVKILLSNTANSNEISSAIRKGEIDEYLQKDETGSLEKLEILIKKYLLSIV